MKYNLLSGQAKDPFRELTYKRETKIKNFLNIPNH